jgi:hypothetical protein
VRRLQLAELEDQSWLPSAIRNGATDLLDFAFDRLGFYDGVAPQLTAALEASGAARIVDLGSGGGGGTLSMRRRLREAGVSVPIVFTDRFPNEAAIARIRDLADSSITYLPDPVDAITGGGSLDGLRTMSGALHHFSPFAVRAIVANIVAKRQPLAFFDVAASPAIRKAPIVVAPILMAVNMAMLFVASLAMAPLVRPVRLSRLLLSYLPPVIPLVVAWDGTVSALRAHTPEELLAIARTVPGGQSYDWRVGAAGRALYLTGWPRDVQKRVEE